MEKTKYDDFLEAMNNLTNEKVAQDCKNLIYLARIYYSHYKQFKGLVQVKRKLLHIYDIADKSISTKKGELSIVGRLYLEFYIKLLRKEGFNLSVNSKCFRDIIRKWDIEVPEALEICNLEETVLKRLQNNLISVCKRTHAQHRKNLNLGMDNIREAINIFQKNKEIEILPEKECFNQVFTEAYIDVLIDVMKNNQAMCHIYIAPVRAQLRYEGREIDSSATKWCYKEDFRYGISELEDEISRYINMFDREIERFIKNEKSLDKILKQVE